MSNSAATTNWHSPLRAIQSKGQRAEKARGLADLARRRAQTEGQFWTPDPVARLMWSFVEQLPVADRRITVLDNSIGSGRLVQFADPAKHAIHGMDTDTAVVKALVSALDEAGFQHDVLISGMEECRARDFDCAVLNPPYSVHLQSPLMEPLPATTWGRFGAHTSATSHHYALDQALSAASLVVALVPLSQAESCWSDADKAQRLQWLIELPGNTFLAEGANVATAVLVFGAPTGKPARRVSLPDAEIYPSMPVDVRPASGRARLSHMLMSESEPTVTLAVTGDRRVRVVRKGRLLRMQFRCGLTEAAVRNAILRARVPQPDSGPGHRYPKSITTVGQGQLDLEVLLLNDDPMGALDELKRRIEAAGGIPSMCPSIRPYLAKRIRKLAIETTPLWHTVFVPAGQGAGKRPTTPFVATVKKRHMLDPSQWGKGGANIGDQLEIRPTPGGDFEYTTQGVTASVSFHELESRFELPQTSSDEDTWQVVAAGRMAAFPARARQLEGVAKAKGIDRYLSWGYQLRAAIEAYMSGGGVIVGAMMGLGKSRIARGLIELGGGRKNLIVVEAHLLDEMAEELTGSGLPPDQWKIIESAKDLDDLRFISIISYSRLRMAVRPGRSTSYGKALRRRFHTVIADEAHCLANDTQQVAALYALAPKVRFGMTGTPCGNYPRHIWPLLVWANGDGTAAQPYGRHRPWVESRHYQSTAFANRGADGIKEFTTTSWVTHEWEDQLSSGAAREVPVLAEIDRFRAYVGRHVLRLVWGQPEVARHVRVKDPEFNTKALKFSDDHLRFYLQVAEEFARWWIAARDEAISKQSLNLVALLAQIGAVFQAANNPQQMDWKVAYPGGLTNKQAYTLDRLEALSEAGHKTICYATSPGTLELLHRELEARGVDSVLYTGRIGRRQRKKQLKRFRHGAASVLLATFGVAQTGLNLPMASAEFFYNRCWSPRQETQALYRALRPQQKHQLYVEYCHFQGSIDEYQAQMVEMKSNAAAVGLDWGIPEYDASDFKHWMSILDNFVSGLAELRGMERGELLSQLRQAA